jgi:O-antigen/teichoic acid export membrane protein
MAYGTSLIGVISGLVTNLWLLRKVTQAVNAADFGIYALVLQITAYLTVLQLGLDFAASRRIAECLAKRDHTGANVAYWQVVRFNRYGAAIAAFILLVIAAGFWSGFGINSMPVGGLAVTVVMLTGGTQILCFLNRAYAAALIGTQRQFIVNLITVANTISTSLLAYTLLGLGMGILCIPVAALAFGFITTFAFARECHRSCSWLTSRAPAPDGAAFKSLVSFGGLTTIGGVAWTIESTSDVIILGAFGGVSLVAIYVLWWRFPSMIFELSTRVVTSAFPTFAQRHGQSPDEARRVFNKVGQLTIGLATLSLIGVSLWLPSFIELWIGNSYSLSDGRSVAMAMAFLIMLRTFGNLFGMFWLAGGDARFPTVLSCFQALTKAGVGLLLVQPLGIVGLVIASCVASTLQALVLGGTLYHQKFIDASFARNAVVMVLTAFAISAGGYYSDFSISLPLFVVGVGATIAAWLVFWLAVSWQSDLRPNLVRLLGALPQRI